MPNEVTEYIKASDNASDYADSLIEGLEQQAREDIDDLYRSPTNRDDELWTLLGVDTELTIDEYDEELLRGIDWSLGVAGISGAATTQFFLVERDDTIIKPAAYREQVLAGFALSKSELVRAGKRGVELVSTARFQVLQAEYLEKFAFLKDLSNTELYNTLLEYNAIRPFEQTVVSAQGYVARMTNYKPGSPQFKQEVAKLIDVNSTRGIKSMNRQAISQIHTLGQIDGDATTPLVWIVEGGPTTCSFCLANAGEVDTYNGWVERGLPGADICLGGDLCRCQLAAY
jgi:hypothetical protein